MATAPQAGLRRAEVASAAKAGEGDARLCALRGSALHLGVLLVFCAGLVGCSRGRPELAEGPPATPVSSLDPALASVIATARQAVVVSPKSGEGWGRLGQAFHAADLNAEALTCYTRAGALDPRSARWLHLAGLLQLQDAPDDAIALLERAAGMGDNPDAPRLRLAQALLERGRLDEAARHLQVLVTVQPGHPAARLELARIQLARGEDQQAARTLEPCLTNNFTARAALLLAAQVKQRLGEAAAAAQLSRRAAAMPRPFDWPDPYLREVQRLRTDRAALAEEVNALLQQQRLKDAERALSRLLAGSPDDPEGLLLLGRLRFQERNCVEAEESLRRHLAVQSDSLNGLIQLALAQLCQQRWAEAVATLRRAVTLKPDFAQAHYNLGYALARAGDAAAAIRSYQDALRCSPGDVSAHVALADELLRSGQTAEARQHLARALELDPADPKARLLRQRMDPPR